MKQGWEIKKLGEVCDIINGFAFKSNLFTDEGENILRISNIQNGYVDLTDIAHFNKTDYPKINFEKYAVLEDDIVVALSGATTGKFGINKTGQKLYLNQRVAICRENTPTLNHLYLLYYLKTQAKSFLESAEGVAQPNLSTEQMKQYDIPIPPREEQERIVEELDCLSGVIEKKREQLRELDALAQSIFYTMFGDPITNEKGWEVKKLGEVCEDKKKILRASKEYAPDDVINYIDISAVDNINNVINIPTPYIFEEAPSRAQQVVQLGDVIVSMVRPNLKNIAIVNCINDNLIASSGFCVLRVRKEMTIPFLFYIVKSDAFTMYLMDRVSGANYPAVRESDITDYISIVPPLALQQEFADKIEAIEKQKELIKQSITQTETLFNARMDYYFN